MFYVQRECIKRTRGKQVVIIAPWVPTKVLRVSSSGQLINETYIVHICCIWCTNWMDHTQIFSGIKIDIYSAVQPYCKHGSLSKSIDHCSLAVNWLLLKQAKCWIMASFDTECCLRFVSFYYTGATNCPLCSAGSYNDKTGQANCVLCPKGMYQSKTGQTGCDVCGAGTYQSAEGNANESYGLF